MTIFPALRNTYTSLAIHVIVVGVIIITIDTFSEQGVVAEY